MKDPELPFFVGYLPTPKSLARFYRILTMTLVVGCGLLGYWLGTQQKPSDPGRWVVDSPITMTGILQVSPYPVLHRTHPDDPTRIESVLLVRQGKHTAASLMNHLDGQTALVTGALIQRGGWTMLEVSSRKNFAVAQDSEQAAIRHRLGMETLGMITLTGEIVDSKCFLGVMKPGHGTIHQPCAEVCLLGGIPAMLVSKAADGFKYGYLLVQADGSPASAFVASMAAKPVTVRGELQRQGDLMYLRMPETLPTPST